jgi:signal transduction histidine kinase
MLAGNSVVTRGYQGIGLGLSVTKQLVGLLDGVILVETQAGKGSVFTVRLPTVDGKNVN